MKLIIISPTGSNVSLDFFESCTLMTESGEITILPGHEALLTVVRPGILQITYQENNKSKNTSYITGGGVLQITHEEVTILVDAINHESELVDDDAEIIKKKEEAEEIIRSYRAEHKEDINPAHLIELEYTYLKYSAMHELHKKVKLHGTSRK